MPVYRLDLAYDGSGFKGFARQPGLRTVQGELESALSKVLGVSVAMSVAGRTDAGVHARGQVVSFEHGGEVDLLRLPRSINGIVGPEVSVLAASQAQDDFSARFSAVWRRYLYRAGTSAAPDPLSRHIVWHAGPGLDVDAMRSTALGFVGQHDFSSFCRFVEGKSNVRRVTELTIEESEDMLQIWVQANAFCHQMVRSIVGYLYDVGRGYSDGDKVGEVIEARDRGKVASVAPAHGLTLWDVGY